MLIFNFLSWLKRDMEFILTFFNKWGRNFNISLTFLYCFLLYVCTVIE